MNKLSSSDRVRIVACLVEGNSLRATVRMTGVHRTTVMKLLVELGTACSDFQDKTLRNLSCKRVQCDEIWSFVGCKEKNVPADKRRQGRGDVWTWTAIDPETSSSLAGLSATATRAPLTTSCMTSRHGSLIASS